MIFETKKKDVFFKIDNFIRASKEVTNDKSLNLILKIFTEEETVILVYENEKERNEDYENLKALLEKKEKIDDTITKLDNVLQGGIV